MGKKKPRKERTTGRGLWDDDGSQFSNPYFERKLGKRRKEGLCVACGKKKCKCKSSEREPTLEDIERQKGKEKLDKYFRKELHKYRNSRSKEGREMKKFKQEEKIERRRVEDERIANKDW